MEAGTRFERYELKFLITEKQRELILAAAGDRLRPDSYGRSNIRNIYFDTPDRLLIRRSIEKPIYKEKLRLRCYGRAAPDSDVFAELKKKYRSVVYKRRLALTEALAMEWLTGNTPCPADSQIGREIEYFLTFYKDLRPALFLSYDREAYFFRERKDLRVTFDTNILCRDSDLSLTSDSYGDPILNEGEVLMEIKTSGGLPLWLTRILSREKIYKTSFSKYGTAYRKYLFSNDPKIKNNKEESVNA